MSLEAALFHARRRAPTGFDFDRLVADYAARNREHVDDWLTLHPNLDACVLEITIKASGRTRCRLRRYRELSDFGGGVPGHLVSRKSTLEHLDMLTVPVGVAAARAEIFDLDWKLLTVAEALSAP